MRRHTFLHGRVARATLLAAGALLVASCGGEPTGPGASCEPPATTISQTAVADLTDADLQSAAADAADRLVANVASGAAGSSLTSAVASLEQGLTSGDTQLACRSARRAISTLDGLAPDAASQPDRSALRLVIEVISARLGDD
jgi:hypothetical protein